MLRQRVHVEGSATANSVGRLLVALLGAAIAWYGLMTVLLAFKASPSFVNDISGYRSAFDYLSGLQAGDISSTDRAILAGVGLILALIALFLVWRGLPRPHLARHDVKVTETEFGTTEIGPRAMERAVEAAALEHPSVVGARARLDDDGIALAITARDAGGLVKTLQEVEERAFASLERHQLELERVDVTLAGYESPNGRELA
jgi:hypothetical protein